MIGSFTGDVHHGEVPTSVEWPADAFHLIQNGAIMRVPTDAQMVLLLAADPDLAMVGPFGNNDAGTETVKGRYTVPIPSRYAHMFLAPRTARDAYETLMGALVNDNIVADCTPLTNFLRLALTRTNPNEGSALRRELPVAPNLPDRIFKDH